MPLSAWGTRSRRSRSRSQRSSESSACGSIERPGGPRPISLTEAGRILVRHADAIQARLLAAKADMVALEAGDAGRLRVGTFQSVGTRVLPTLLRRFSGTHSAGRGVLRESTDEAELLEMIERGELDLTFWTLPVAAAVRLRRAPARPLRARRPGGVTAGRARAHAHAEGDRAPAADRVQPLQRDGRGRVVPRLDRALAEHRVRSDNNGTVQGLVGAGVGISVAPLLTVDEDDPSTVDRPPGASRRGSSGSSGTATATAAAAEAFVDTALAVCPELSQACPSSRGRLAAPERRRTRRRLDSLELFGSSGPGGSGPMPATTVSCDRSWSRSRPRLTAPRNLSRFTSSVERMLSAQSSISSRVSRAFRRASSTMSSAWRSAS